MTNSRKKTDAMEVYILLFVDLICVICSYLLAIAVKFRNASYVDFKELHAVVCAGILLYCAVYNSVVNYNRNFLRRGKLAEFSFILKRNLTMGLVVISLLFMVKEAEHYSRLVFGYFLIIDQIMTYLVHLLIKRYMRKQMTKKRNQTQVCLITDRESAVQTIAQLRRGADLNLNIGSMILWNPEEELPEVQRHLQEELQVMAEGDAKAKKLTEEIHILGSRADYQEICKQIPLDEVFIHLPGVDRNRIDELIRYFETMGVVCHYNIDMNRLDTKAACVEEFAGYTVVTYEENYIDAKHLLIKRCMDILGSLVGLVITGILFPFVALAIKLDSPGPVTFAQTRIGKNGRRFKVYKFRSMYIDAEQRKKELMEKNQVKGLMFKMEDDPRITKVGKFIRKTSIDELPQFYNILIGDMSLIGTRPPTIDEFEQYTPYYRKRLSMTPGLTGMWQVSGRSDINDFDEVVKLDINYIDNWSLSLDLKILLKTVYVVLFSRGAK